MADGQPVVLKQFVQFCLIIVYPGWVLGIIGCLIVYGLMYVTVYPVLCVLLWPMRAWMKKNRPEGIRGESAHRGTALATTRY